MPPPAEKKPDLKTTAAIALSCLLLGIPVAGVAINLESTFMPTVPLRQADAIINDSHIALFAAAFMSIIASVIVMLASVVVRHLMLKNVMIGLVGFGLGATNFAAQIIILALIYITNATNPESKSRNEVRLINGQYDTGGKRFTHETFSCMMGNLYLDREPWSTNACSEYHYARYCIIVLVNCAFLLLAISYWPVRNHLVTRRGSAPAGKAG